MKGIICWECYEGCTCVEDHNVHDTGINKTTK